MASEKKNNINNSDVENLDYYLMFDKTNNCIYEVNYDEKSVYSGKLNNTKLFEDGNTYQIVTGNIINGFIVGIGRSEGSNGNIAEGEFVNANLINGKFKYGGSCNIYEGTFINNKLNGDNCTMTRPNGCIYTGSFKDGKCIGITTIKYINGDTYVGTCDNKNGELHEGTYTTYNNVIYEGKFTNNKLNGSGIIKYSDAIYKGNVINNMKKGNGVLEYKDGRKYVGEFNDKFIEGKKYKNGKLTYNGKYKNDILVVGFYYLYDEDGTVHKFDSNNNPVRDTKIIYALKDTINILKEIVYKNEKEIMELRQMLEKYINQ